MKLFIGALLTLCGSIAAAPDLELDHSNLKIFSIQQVTSEPEQPSIQDFVMLPRSVLDRQDKLLSLGLSELVVKSKLLALPSVTKAKNKLTKVTVPNRSQFLFEFEFDESISTPTKYANFSVINSFIPFKLPRYVKLDDYFAVIPNKYIQKELGVEPKELSKKLKPFLKAHSLDLGGIPIADSDAPLFVIKFKAGNKKLRALKDINWKGYADSSNSSATYFDRLAKSLVKITSYSSLRHSDFCAVGGLQGYCAKVNDDNSKVLFSTFTRSQNVKRDLSGEVSEEQIEVNEEENEEFEQDKVASSEEMSLANDISEPQFYNETDSSTLSDPQYRPHYNPNVLSGHYRKSLEEPPKEESIDESLEIEETDSEDTNTADSISEFNKRQITILSPKSGKTLGILVNQLGNLVDETLKDKEVRDSISSLKTKVQKMVQDDEFQMSMMIGKDTDNGLKSQAIPSSKTYSYALQARDVKPVQKSSSSSKDITWSLVFQQHRLGDLDCNFD